jgi:acyl transferase domain-containing protein
VLEEYIPGRLTKTKQVTSVESVEKPPESRNISTNSNSTLKAPLRGALVLGASESKELLVKLEETYKKLLAGKTLANTAPLKSDLQAFERIAIDYQDQKDLLDKLQKAIKAMQSNNLGMWKALRAQGIFRGSGAKPKVAFLYTGQGSQYVNMLGQLAKIEPIIAQTFTETDQVMTPLLGKALTEYIFVDPTNEQLVKQAEKDLRQTSITQPAVLAVDLALTHLLESYGIKAD